MPQRRGPDQQVEVADEVAFSPQAAALPSEDPAGLLVKVHDVHGDQKVTQAPFTISGISRANEAFVNLGQRNDAQADSLGAQLSEACGHMSGPVQIVNDSVRINEVTHRLEVRRFPASP